MGADADGDQQRPGPGYRLREAREARGLSVGEVAGALRLNEGVIRALEADAFESLAEPIFVKGYLNAYCKLVGLPADECIAEYERAAGRPMPPPLTARRSTGEHLASASPPVMLVTWLVAAAAVVMVVLWWLARPEPPPAPVEERAPVSVPEPIAEPAWAPRVVDTAPPPEAPEPVADVVRARFMFADESWTEVIDADGRRLLFDLVPAGREIEVEGRPPLQVFLGNAPGVRIAVDGQPFDHARYTRAGNVARFELDP